MLNQAKDRDRGSIGKTRRARAGLRSRRRRTAPRVRIEEADRRAREAERRSPRTPANSRTSPNGSSRCGNRFAQIDGSSMRPINRKVGLPRLSNSMAVQRMSKLGNILDPLRLAADQGDRSPLLGDPVRQALRLAVPGLTKARKEQPSAKRSTPPWWRSSTPRAHMSVYDVADAPAGFRQDGGIFSS